MYYKIIYWLANIDSSKFFIFSLMSGSKTKMAAQLTTERSAEQDKHWPAPSFHEKAISRIA